MWEQIVLAFLWLLKQIPHKLYGLKQHKFIISQLWRLFQNPGVSIGLVPSRGSEAESVPLSQLPVAAGDP